ATAFATIVNSGDATAPGCGLTLATSLPADFAFQTTDSATNRIVGTPNTAVDIAAGSSQTFVFAITPRAPIAPQQVPVAFECANGAVVAPIVPGVNTLQFSADAGPVPDIVALATLDPATPGPPRRLHPPRPGRGRPLRGAHRHRGGGERHPRPPRHGGRPAAPRAGRLPDRRTGALPRSARLQPDGDDGPGVDGELRGLCDG